MSVVVLSIPGLQQTDLSRMPRVSSLVQAVRPLDPVFPALTLPAQMTIATGCTPQQHGVVGNGFYWPQRETPDGRGEVEMWTAWNDVVQRPQIWTTLETRTPHLNTMVWFPLLAKGAKADFICTPAPIHNPDGSESLWCYSQPEHLYGLLRDSLGHFPLHKFWGPIAGIEGSDWIVDSAVVAARQAHPELAYIYLPHLDYKAQSHGPDSPEHQTACGELDTAIGRLVDNWPGPAPTWLVASEYAISPVVRPIYPNRLLREGGWLDPVATDDGEHLMPGRQRAWAMADHQIAHVFVADEADTAAVADLFREQPGIDRVLTGSTRGMLDHPRSGQVVLVADPDAWFAYYWWLDDANAPGFARTVDIHRKPGYDPVEMFLDRETRQTPLDATLVRGSHGRDDVPGILASSDADWLPRDRYHQTDIAELLLGHFGMTPEEAA